MRQHLEGLVAVGEVAVHAVAARGPMLSSRPSFCSVAVRRSPCVDAKSSSVTGNGGHGYFDVRDARRLDFSKQYGAWSKTLRFLVGKGTLPNESEAVQDLASVHLAVVVDVVQVEADRRLYATLRADRDDAEARFGERAEITGERQLLHVFSIAEI